MIISSPNCFNHHIAGIINGVGVISPTTSHGVSANAAVDPIVRCTPEKLIASSASIKKL